MATGKEPEMTKRSRKLVLFGMLIVAVSVYAYDRFWEPKEEIAITLEWGRLAPFPESERDFTIHATGNMFTRGFRTHFKAPIADIRAWLANSPGTQSLTPERKGSQLPYEIKPGGGAQWAEVTVDEKEESVDIYVYWS
jgi:hypothetical protein